MTKKKRSIAIELSAPKVQCLKENESKNDRIQRAIVGYLLSGSIAATAKQYNIAETTLRDHIHRLQSNDEQLNKYRAQAFKLIIDKTVALTSKIQDIQVRKIDRIANDPDEMKKTTLSEISVALNNNFKILSRLQQLCETKSTIVIEESGNAKLEDFV